MDNRKIEVISRGKSDFDLVLTLFQKKGVAGYRIDGKRIILYWVPTKNVGFVPFPYVLNIQQAANFVWGWLESVEYGDEPDHDGSNSKGWKVSCGDWGHIDGEWEAFVVIEPAWALHGK